MKHLLTLFFVFIAVCAKSQTRSEYYITKSNDTVRCEILKIHLLTTFVYPYTLEVRVNGERKQFYASDLKEFVSYNTSSEELRGKFVNPDGKDRMIKQILVGKLSLFHTYSLVYGWGGANMPLKLTVRAVTTTVFVKNGESTKLEEGKLFSFSRSVKAKLIEDCPDLYKDLMDNKLENISTEDLVRAYNDCMSAN